MLNSLHGQFTGLLNRAVDTCSNSCQQGSAKGWSFLRIGCHQFDSQNVSDHLAPEGASGTPTCCPHLINLQTLFINDSKTISQAKGHALQNRANQVSAVVDCAQANPATTSIGVKVRSSFPLQVGQKE